MVRPTRDDRKPRSSKPRVGGSNPSGRANQPTETTDLSFLLVDSVASSQGNGRASKSHKGRRKSHGKSHGFSRSVRSQGLSFGLMQPGLAVGGAQRRRELPSRGMSRSKSKRSCHDRRFRGPRPGLSRSSQLESNEAPEFVINIEAGGSL